MTSDERLAMRGAQKIERTSFSLLRVNYKSILNKSLDIGNRIYTYNPDVTIGT
jgi:hypothetical protein